METVRKYHSHNSIETNKARDAAANHKREPNPVTAGFSACGVDSLKSLALDHALNVAHGSTDALAPIFQPSVLTMRVWSRKLQKIVIEKNKIKQKTPTDWQKHVAQFKYTKKKQKKQTFLW